MIQKQEFLTDRPVLAKSQGDASTRHNSDDIKIAKNENLAIFSKMQYIDMKIQNSYSALLKDVRLEYKYKMLYILLISYNFNLLF